MLDQGEGNRGGESLIPDLSLPNPTAGPGGPSPGGGIMDFLNNAVNSASPATPRPSVPLQVPAGATEPERHEMRLVIGPEVRHVTLEANLEGDSPRRWRVAGDSFGDSGFAMAADMPVLDGMAPPSDSPAEADQPEESAEDDVPLDDE
jgi:hypothetical protein